MRLTKRSILWMLVAIVIIGGLFVFAATTRWRKERTMKTEQAVQASKKKTRIAMKWFFAGTMSPYFAAQRNTIFDSANLDVTLLPGGPQNPSIRQVLLNNADFGITGAHELALARSEDQPVQAVAVIFKISPVCLASLATTKIRRPEDLVGKKVEMTSGDNAEFEYLAMLAKNHVDPKSITNVRWLFRYDKLLSGESDAAVVYANDQAITLKQDKEISLLCPHDWGITPYADVLFTRQDVIDKDPEWVGSVVSALLESWEWSGRNREETVRLFQEAPEIKSQNLSAKTMLAVLDTSLTFVQGKQPPDLIGNHVVGIGVQDGERWQETIDLLKAYGSVQKLPSAESCFTNRWVKLHDMEDRDKQSQSK